ncbi:uncharacterized protein LOC144492308 [Mustelus asterias]
MNLNGDYLQLILTLQCTHMLLQITEGESERIEVSQSPPEIKAPEGKTINMECACEEALQMDSIRFDWTKDSKPILNSTSSTKTKVYDNRLSYTISKAKAKLEIKSITQDDAGLYRCEVFIEIPPPVRKGSGNGTQLIVQASQNNYWPVLGAFILLVILVPAILYYKKRQKSQRNSTMPVPVHVVREEVNEENHENEGNEENSSSRGSSHWMTSSLYESFDYFAIRDENEEISCAASDR